MLSGNLKYRIRILSFETITNDYNEREERTVLHKSVRAGFKSITGKLAFIDQQSQPQRTVKFTIRFLPSVEEGMLVEHKGDLYKVIYIQHVRESETYLTATLTQSSYESKD